MQNFNLPVTENSKDEWLTPPTILAALGVFDLDPCAPVSPPWDTAKHHYNITQEGLKQNWFGRAQPALRRRDLYWMKKLADHGNGIALTFARTETKGFHAQVWERADALFFFKGRLKFFHVDGSQAKNRARMQPAFSSPMEREMLRPYSDCTNTCLASTYPTYRKPQHEQHSDEPGAHSNP